VAEGVSAPVLGLPVRGMMVVPDRVRIPLEENRLRAELGFPVGPGKDKPPSATTCKLDAVIKPEEDDPASVLRLFLRLASSSSSTTVLKMTTPSSSSSSSLSVISNPSSSPSTSIPESQSVVVPATLPDLVLIPPKVALPNPSLDLVCVEREARVRDFLNTGFLGLAPVAGLEGPA